MSVLPIHALRRLLRYAEKAGLFPYHTTPQSVSTYARSLVVTFGSRSVPTGARNWTASRGSSRVGNVFSGNPTTSGGYVWRWCLVRPNPTSDITIGKLLKLTASMLSRYATRLLNKSRTCGVSNLAAVAVPWARVNASLGTTRSLTRSLAKVLHVFITPRTDPNKPRPNVIDSSKVTRSFWHSREKCKDLRPQGSGAAARKRRMGWASYGNRAALSGRVSLTGFARPSANTLR